MANGRALSRTVTDAENIFLRPNDFLAFIDETGDDALSDPRPPV
jgi:hypothetical protein